jgi:hypothetical protein
MLSPQLSERISHMDRAERTKFRMERIKAFDFEAAWAVDDQSNAERQAITSATIQRIVTNLQADIEDAFGAYTHQLSIIDRHFEDIEIEHRVAIDNVFQQRKREHIEELKEIEKACAYETIREERRPVPEKIELLRLAQKYAKLRNYPPSIDLREEADEKVKIAQQERRLQVRQRYDKIRQNVFERQKSDLLIVNQKLCAELTVVAHERADARDHEVRTFQVAVRAIQQDAIHSANAAIPTAREKTEVVAQIKEATAAIVMDLAGIEWPSDTLRSSPLRSPNAITTSRASSSQAPRVTPRRPISVTSSPASFGPSDRR